MTTELTKLPPEETVRRLRMAKAVVPAIKPDTFDMEDWFDCATITPVRDATAARIVEPLRYDKGDVRLCGTAACFAGHLALRPEFQELGLGFDEGGGILVPGTTPLPDGRVVRMPPIATTMEELGWFLGVSWGDASDLFDPESWLHTNEYAEGEEDDQLSPEASLKAIDGHLDELIAGYEQRTAIEGVA